MSRSGFHEALVDPGPPPEERNRIQTWSECPTCGKSINYRNPCGCSADLPGKTEPEAYAELAAKAGLIKQQEIEHEYTPCRDCLNVDGNHDESCMTGERS